MKDAFAWPMKNPDSRFSLTMSFCLAAMLVLGLAWLLPRVDDRRARQGDGPSPTPASGETVNNERRSFSRGDYAPAKAATPEEVVQKKVQQFARNRRATVKALAEQFKTDLPPEVERFFTAAESGNWDELKAAYEALQAMRKSDAGAGSLHHLWAGIMETWGVAETAHEWPAQHLLDYGNAILGSLRPGMIYVGGTDPGRFIPTLMSQTDAGEQRVVLTQNAFADASYMEYVRFLYGDQVAVPSGEDSSRAFQDYLSDAQRRLQHDMLLPNEDKQIRPGEDIQMIDNRVQVSGQVAVMAINEKLMQNFLKLNPEVSFAMEESFPFTSTYAASVPIGPVIELRGLDAQSTFTSERATQTLDYWKTAANQLLADPTFTGSSEVRQAYSKMAAAQAGLLESHQFTSEAEQTYRLAMELSPGNAEPVYRLGKFLADQGRKDEARQLLDAFAAQNPGESSKSGSNSGR
jgi:hypothetical protein